MIHQLEEIMYLMSDFFMAPVLIILVLLFIYSLYALGMFASQAWQRYQHQKNYRDTLQSSWNMPNKQSIPGYSLFSLARANPEISRDALDVAAFEELEGVRTVSRLAPMLGLIATMVPMGPALKALADGNIQGISENLIVAFSAVIFGLVIASITFWIASVKKRWFANELVAVAEKLEQHKKDTLEANLREAA